MLRAPSGWNLHNKLPWVATPWCQDTCDICSLGLLGICLSQGIPGALTPFLKGPLLPFCKGLCRSFPFSKGLCRGFAIPFPFCKGLCRGLLFPFARALAAALSPFPFSKGLCRGIVALAFPFCKGFGRDLPFCKGCCWLSGTISQCLLQGLGAMSMDHGACPSVDEGFWSGGRAACLVWCAKDQRHTMRIHRNLISSFSLLQGQLCSNFLFQGSFLTLFQGLLLLWQVPMASCREV